MTVSRSIRLGDLKPDSAHGVGQVPGHVYGILADKKCREARRLKTISRDLRLHRTGKIGDRDQSVCVVYHQNSPCLSHPIAHTATGCLKDSICEIRLPPAR